MRKLCKSGNVLVLNHGGLDEMGSCLYRERIMNEMDALRNEIRDFLKKTGMAPSTFGKLAVNNSKLVERIEAGGSVTVPLLARIRKFIAEELEPRSQALLEREERARNDRRGKAKVPDPPKRAQSREAA